jgi:hypothetical protein
MASEIEQMHDEIYWLESNDWLSASAEDDKIHWKDPYNVYGVSVKKYADWCMKRENLSYFEATDEIRRKGSIHLFSQWAIWRIKILRQLMYEARGHAD